MASEELIRLGDALRPNAAALVEMSLEGQRSLWEGIGTAYPVPADTDVVPIELDGVPAERVAAPGVDASRAVLHFHGGGYAIGSCTTHRELAARLSAACGAPVVVPEYRLAPEHRFPAASDDAWRSYAAISDELGPGAVALSGDSAGGGLALAVAQEAARRDDGRPCRLVLWSPWVDLEVADDAVADAVLTPAWLRWCAEAYLDGTAVDDPRASPVHGSFAGLPPTLVIVATGELLHRQATQVVAALKAADVPSEITLFDHDVHLWMVLGPTAPESAASVTSAGAFIAGGWATGALP